MLIVFSGLPGVGKTTLSRALALRCSAVFLRIDSIEQAIRNIGVDVGAAGYEVAQALAESNLAQGLSVVADCVNPVAESRAGWQQVADTRQSPIYNIEVVCTDVVEHQHRVQMRVADIRGHIVPRWEAVQSLAYEPWTSERLVVDTSSLAPDEALARIERYIGLLPNHHI